MPYIWSSNNGVADMTETPDIPAAIIFVDGEEFIRVWLDDAYALFDATVERVGGEVALMVWKPKLGIFLRERLSYSASKE
jgi:hypothetical protein